MKTTDLIPLILYQLVDGDKYGYEIVKQIEDASNGEITIKQPTLYSVLKKLEQGKFISSYWQDSDIGGKRHYYKLTPNGSAQLDTYPPFEQLIKDAMGESFSFNLDTKPASAVAQSNAEPSFATQEIISIKPIDITLPHFDITKPITPLVTQEEHAEPEIKAENITDFNIQSNIEHIEQNMPDNNFVAEVEPEIEVSVEEVKIDAVVEEKAEENAINSAENVSSGVSIFDAIEPVSFTYPEVKTTENAVPSEELAKSKEEEFVKEEKVSAFTENITPVKITPSNNKLYSKLSPASQETFETKTLQPEFNAPINDIERVSYIDYLDFATDSATIKRRKALSKNILKMAFTTLTLLAILILSVAYIQINNLEFSKMFCICLIGAGLFILLYPAILLNSYTKLRIKYSTKPFYYPIVKDLVIKLMAFLILVIIIFAYNISILNSFTSIFKLSNFANFIAPLAFSAIIMIDFVYSAMIYRKYKV